MSRYWNWFILLLTICSCDIAIEQKVSFGTGKKTLNGKILGAVKK